MALHLHRRSVLAGIADAVIASCDKAMAMSEAAEQIYAIYVAALPGTRTATTGIRALSDWERGRARGKGWPIVIGSDEQLGRVAEQAHGFEGEPPRASARDILARADKLSHPARLIAYQKGQEEGARAELASLTLEERQYEEMTIGPDGKLTKAMIDPLAQDDTVPELGAWPDAPPPSPGLSVAEELGEAEGGYAYRPAARATILTLPTDDWTQAPALLNWGGWNECPPPEFHVAAFRSWRERYGAELVGMSADTLNLRVKRRPESRDAALELAREFYAYCPDVVDQGVGTLSNLAAGLMADDWWFFWWD